MTMPKRDYDSTVARIAGNLLSGRQWYIPRNDVLGHHERPDPYLVAAAVETARLIVTEVRRTEQPQEPQARPTHTESGEEIIGWTAPQPARPIVRAKIRHFHDEDEPQVDRSDPPPTEIEQATASTGARTCPSTNHVWSTTTCRSPEHGDPCDCGQATWKATGAPPSEPQWARKTKQKCPACERQLFTRPTGRLGCDGPCGCGRVFDPPAAQPPAEVPIDCAVQAISSRVCQHGTRGCIVDHARPAAKVTAAPEGEPGPEGLKAAIEEVARVMQLCHDKSAIDTLWHWWRVYTSAHRKNRRGPELVQRINELEAKLAERPSAPPDKCRACNGTGGGESRMGSGEWTCNVCHGTGKATGAPPNKTK